MSDDHRALGEFEFGDKEIDILLSAICDRYGYDFKNYARSSLKRRLSAYLRKRKNLGFQSIVETLISKKAFFVDFLNEVTISTTELFRDPEFFSSFRRNIIPKLQSLRNFKIWHAGCSTGEEVFSIAILLAEAGLLERALVYGTDINAYAIEKAKTGKVSANVVARDTKNYHISGGRESFAKYWTSEDKQCVLHPDLLKRLVFGEHNLVTDASFGEMEVICCRNVLIYFNESLQNRALELFRDSLSDRGFLCLGSKESLLATVVKPDFEVIDNKVRIYKKISSGEPALKGRVWTNESE